MDTSWLRDGVLEEQSSGFFAGQSSSSTAKWKKDLLFMEVLLAIPCVCMTKLLCTNCGLKAGLTLSRSAS